MLSLLFAHVLFMFCSRLALVFLMYAHVLFVCRSCAPVLSAVLSWLLALLHVLLMCCSTSVRVLLMSLSCVLMCRRGGRQRGLLHRHDFHVLLASCSCVSHVCSCAVRVSLMCSCTKCCSFMAACSTSCVAHVLFYFCSSAAHVFVMCAHVPSGWTTARAAASRRRSPPPRAAARWTPTAAAEVAGSRKRLAATPREARVLAKPALGGAAEWQERGRGGGAGPTTRATPHHGVWSISSALLTSSLLGLRNLRDLQRTPDFPLVRDPVSCAMAQPSVSLSPLWTSSLSLYI